VGLWLHRQQKDVTIVINSISYHLHHNLLHLEGIETLEEHRKHLLHLHHHIHPNIVTINQYCKLVYTHTHTNTHARNRPPFITVLSKMILLIDCIKRICIVPKMFSHGFNNCTWYMCYTCTQNTTQQTHSLNTAVQLQTVDYYHPNTHTYSNFLTQQIHGFLPSNQMHETWLQVF